MAGWLILIGWLLAAAGLWMHFGLWAGLLMLGAVLFLYGMGMYQMAKQKEAFDRLVGQAKERRGNWN